MFIIYTLNFIIGIVTIILSAITASFFFVSTLSLSGAGTESDNLLFFPILILSFIIFYFSFIGMAIIYCRVILFFCPTKTGIFPDSSKVQLLRVTADVLTSRLCSPVCSIMPFLITFMGGQTGRAFVFSGKIFNSDLLEAGDNVIIGADAFICGHLQQSNKMILGKIKIGNEVTIGVRSFIMPNVTIGDRSILAANSVVPMDTIIPSDEIWGGVPAKRIGPIK